MSRSAISAYREALRATAVAFKGDAKVLSAARQRIREGYELNRELADSEKVEKAITELREVAKFLVQNIVQGEQKEDGKYFLKFHSKTELGDNETIKHSKKEMGSLAGAKARRRER